MTRHRCFTAELSGSFPFFSEGPAISHLAWINWCLETFWRSKLKICDAYRAKHFWEATVVTAEFLSVSNKRGVFDAYTDSRMDNQDLGRSGGGADNSMVSASFAQSVWETDGTNGVRGVGSLVFWVTFSISCIMGDVPAACPIICQLVCSRGGIFSLATAVFRSFIWKGVCISKSGGARGNPGFYCPKSALGAFWSGWSDGGVLWGCTPTLGKRAPRNSNLQKN